jgi:hypothetical protein
MVLIHLFGAANMLFYQLTTMVLERDWVVVIAAHDDAWQRKITSNLKQIDLCCDLVAPSIVSLLNCVSSEAIVLVLGWVHQAPLPTSLSTASG